MWPLEEDEHVPLRGEGVPLRVGPGHVCEQAEGARRVTLDEEGQERGEGRAVFSHRHQRGEGVLPHEREEALRVLLLEVAGDVQGPLLAAGTTAQSTRGGEGHSARHHSASSAASSADSDSAHQ